MANSLNELNPRLLWKHFAKILTIPHCSGNEKALGDYVLSVAASLGLPGKRDKVGNVVVSKPATAGRGERRRRHPPGPPRHGLREELEHGPRLLQGPDQGRDPGRVGLRPGHDARRGQRHRPGRRPGGHGGQVARPRPPRIPVHGRRGDRPDRRQQDPEGLPRRQDAPQPRQRGRGDVHHRLRRRRGFDPGPAARTEEDGLEEPLPAARQRLPRRPFRARHQPGPGQRHQAPGPDPRPGPGGGQVRGRQRRGRQQAQRHPPRSRGRAGLPAGPGPDDDHRPQEGLRQDQDRVQGRRAGRGLRPRAGRPARTSP